jgi:hypothetical protein
MSRGPGMWQRGILAALEKYPAVYLMDLLPQPRTRSQVVALNRAARQLANSHRIEIHRWMCRAAESGFIVVARPGYRVRARKDVPRVSVASVPSRNWCNTNT